MNDAAGLGRVADTLSGKPAIGHLNQVCERWIYTCLSFALDSEEQTQSGFRYQYSVYQVEYSRNLLLEVGGQMEQVFQALVDRTRAPLNVDRIKTILGRRHRPHRRRASGRGWGVVVVEKPTYDLTVFKVHCGRLTLKIYTKGEHVLRLEAIAHHTRELGCLRSLPHFPEIVSRLGKILERFVETLSCLDACFIADDTLERMPLPAQVGALISTDPAPAGSPQLSWPWRPHPEASRPLTWPVRCACEAVRASPTTDPGALPTT